MMRITNISITDAARQVLDRRKSVFKPRADDVFALTYMSSFINSDGTTVEGFRPGYAISPWPVEYLSPNWVMVQLSGGTEFHLMPRFKWSARERYNMDLVSPSLELFSIIPVPAGTWG
ncbi:MAG: hypothetical protein ACYC0C_15905 [Devosia sp.]